jgi:hypothetical protein
MRRRSRIFIVGRAHNAERETEAFARRVNRRKLCEIRAYAGASGMRGFGSSQQGELLPA